MIPIERHEVFGVAYEFYIHREEKYAARIRVYDVDAQELVGVTFYPTVEMARAAYAKLIQVS